MAGRSEEEKLIRTKLVVAAPQGTTQDTKSRNML